VRAITTTRPIGISATFYRLDRISPPAARQRQKPEKVVLKTGQMFFYAPDGGSRPWCFPRHRVLTLGRNSRAQEVFEAESFASPDSRITQATRVANHCFAGHLPAVRRRGSRHVFSLAPTPLANAFVHARGTRQEQRRYPLDVFFCVKLRPSAAAHVIDPVALYEHYVYVSGHPPCSSSTSTDTPTMSKAISSSNRRPGGRYRFHDGKAAPLFFKDSGRRVLGVDRRRKSPSDACFRNSYGRRIFTPTLAARIRREHGRQA